MVGLPSYPELAFDTQR
jgi:hypothetical protein